MAPSRPAFESLALERGVTLHHRRARRFKTDFVRIYARVPLDAKRVERNLFAAASMRGTALYPSIRSLRAHLDDLFGATYGVSAFSQAGRHHVAYGGSAVSGRHLPGRPDNLARLFAFLGEALRGPVQKDGGIDPAIFAQEQRTLRRELEGRADDKVRYSVERLRELLYAGHVYGQPETGTAAEIDAAAPGASLAEGLRALREGEVDVYVYADCTLRQAERLARRWLGFTPRTPEGRFAIDLNAPRRRPRTVRERIPLTQGRLAMGFRLEAWDRRGSMALPALSDAILGSGPASKLFRNVRERLSLCYDARSFVDPIAGSIIIMSGIDPERYRQVRREILRQVGDMAEGRISGDEVEAARARLVSALESVADTQSGLIGFFHGRRLLGQTERNLEEVVANLRGLDARGVPRLMARARLDSVFFLDRLETPA